MGQSERLKAIVLRRTNYAEADRVLQLLTPKAGAVSSPRVCVASGQNWQAVLNYLRFATW